MPNSAIQWNQSIGLEPRNSTILFYGYVAQCPYKRAGQFKQDYLMLETKSRSDLSEPLEPAKAEEKSLESVSKNDVTIVLPVLNEEAGLAAVVDDVLKNGYQNLLVIDGYSTDNTQVVAQTKGVKVLTQHGRGKTGAIRTAIEQTSTPYMLVMDGDYTYDAADIQRFLDHAKRYDQIVGSRQSENIKPLHRLGNHLISLLFNILFGTTVSDVCSGMYLMNSRAAKQLALRTKGFSVEVEVLAQMSLQGKITEVPISYRKRIGKPKLATWVHGVDIIRSILSLAREHNPVFLFSLVAASAAIPGIAILAWVAWAYATPTPPYGHLFHSGWALAGLMLLLLSSQAFIVGTISVLLKRTELRIERLLRTSD